VRLRGEGSTIDYHQGVAGKEKDNAQEREGTFGKKGKCTGGRSLKSSMEVY